MATIIEFQDAVLGYGSKAILRGITFSIDTGDYFGLVGPNGAGKTTILRTILGTLRPLSGTVTAQGENGLPLRFGYVPQRDTIDYALPYTVEEVVMMGRYRQRGLFRRPGREDREAVGRCLDHVAIADLAGLAFKELSGGQKQRVLIARALASEPGVLVLDEPTNGMDLSSRLAILELVHRLHREDGLTVLLVSHLLEDVANYVSRLAIVERDFFKVGKVDEILTGQNLSTMYEVPVDVRTIDGRKVILSGGGNGGR